MRKADMIDRIAKETGIPKVDVLVTLENFFKIVRDTVVRGEGVYVRGFGTFIAKKKARKLGRDIKRNIAIEIPARRIPLFKPAREFREQLLRPHQK